MNSTRYILAAAIALIASCAPKAIPVPEPHTRGAAVPVAQDAAPRVSELRDAHVAADRQGERVDAEAGRVGTQSGLLAEAMRRVRAEVERLRKNATATEAELIALAADMAIQAQRAEELAVEADTLRKSLASERELRRQTYARIEPLELAVRDGNIERASLRLQIADAENAATAQSKLAQTYAKAASQANAKADKAKGHISVWRNIAIFSSSIALLAIAFIIFKPRIL